MPDVGFDEHCSEWIVSWVAEAIELNKDDDHVGITYFISVAFRYHVYALEAARAYPTYLFDRYKELDLIATVRVTYVSSCVSFALHLPSIPDILMKNAGGVL